MKKTYQERKEEIRQKAIDYSLSFADGVIYSWSETAEITAYFEEYGHRFWLLREFRENGII